MASGLAFVLPLVLSGPLQPSGEAAGPVLVR